MNDNPVSEQLCTERRKIEEEHFRQDKKRLDKLDPLMEKLSTCTVQNAQIIKNHEERLTDHERRIDDIEHRPGNWWDKAITGLIAAAVSALWSLLAK